VLADRCEVALIESLGRSLGLFGEEFEIFPAFSLAAKMSGSAEVVSAPSGALPANFAPKIVNSD
jgi:hypothetical protein